MRDPRVVEWLRKLKGVARGHRRHAAGAGAGDAGGVEARHVADRVTATLLSDAARRAVLARLGDGERSRARLTVRVARHDTGGTSAD